MRQGDFRGRFQRFAPSRSDDKHAINEQISAPEVRVVGADGSQLGVMRTRDAITLAQEQGLDLVEVAANISPPVCKLIDYGKLKYREQKKAAEARKKSSTSTTKELRIRYSTDTHDLETKVRNARRFLEDGDKVKFEMRFRGREVVYQELGRETFKQIIEMLQDIGVVEEQTSLVGYRMHLSFAPKAKSTAK